MIINMVIYAILSLLLKYVPNLERKGEESYVFHSSQNTL